MFLFVTAKENVGSSTHTQKMRRKESKIEKASRQNANDFPQTNNYKFQHFLGVIMDKTSDIIRTYVCSLTMGLCRERPSLHFFLCEKPIVERKRGKRSDEISWHSFGNHTNSTQTDWIPDIETSIHFAIFPRIKYIVEM